eukprot:TRINITY_DN248_c0_g2_i20.p1 TRINITY_DN248_c0_g2~~TRINITY_DN248_c0_g2_i20.p1  ORF type:complete len:333 (+),score=38.98 TRINITY_DN248_c0_g2_i20:232-1230(+)
MENILTLFVNDPLGKGAHIRRTEWTGKNLLLKKAAESCGTGGWSPAANHASKMASGTLRSSKQCRFRWQKHLHLLSLKDAWSEREEAELLLAYRRFRSNWPAISNALGGKSVSSIKNRLYLIFKKVKNKIKKRNYSLSSKSEILKMHYVLFVMKDYLARATGPEFLVQVASKDFICKLLKQITPEVLDTYITIFQEKAGFCGTMQELLEQIIMESEPARIEIPEETVEEEAQLDYTTSEPPPMESLAKHKELFSCEATVLELPDDVHRYSRHISSADLTTAAEAPCFQTEPDNFGFSEFAERAWQAISPKGLPNTLSNMGEDKMHETGNAAV